MGYWFIVLNIGLWKWYNGTLLDADWKHTKMMRALRRKEMEEVRNGGVGGKGGLV